MITECRERDRLMFAFSNIDTDTGRDGLYVALENFRKYGHPIHFRLMVNEQLLDKNRLLCNTANMKSSLAVTKIRDILKSGQTVTLSDVRKLYPELLPGEISSSFCYLVRKGEAVREQVANTTARKQTHKQVWQYRRAKNEG